MVRRKSLALKIALSRWRNWNVLWAQGLDEKMTTLMSCSMRNGKIAWRGSITSITIGSSSASRFMRCGSCSIMSFLKADVRRISSLGKLIIEHEPHLINRLAELDPMVIEVIDLLHAIFPFRIEQLISVVIFSSKPCAHKTFQFLQRESAIFSAKLFLRTIATGTGKAAALVFLSAAAGTGVISADFTHDSIQESYSPDSTRRSKEGPLLASRS